MLAGHLGVKGVEGADGVVGCMITGVDHMKYKGLCKTGGLSYSRLREVLLDEIAKLGFDPAMFGMHSLHAGGTTAAANGGVQGRLRESEGQTKSRAGVESDSPQPRPL